MFMRTTALVLVLTATGLGCETTLYRSEDTEAKWVEYDLENGPPSRDLYRLCQVAVVRAGFPPGPSDESTGRLESGWNVNLAPYAYKGFREKAIIKVEPRNWITNFETNYLPYIDFYDEDFPWRYTPAAPSAANPSRLRPWIALVVLREEEFTDAPRRPGSPLPSIKVTAST